MNFCITLESNRENKSFPDFCMSFIIIFDCMRQDHVPRNKKYCYKKEVHQVNMEGEGEEEDVLAGFVVPVSHQTAQCGYPDTHRML